MIKKELYDLLPTWAKELESQSHCYGMVMTNDMDSFLSCILLHSQFGIPLVGFYDFTKGIYLKKNFKKEYKEGKSNIKELLYIDCAVIQRKCFDNHMTHCQNPRTCNPNVYLKESDSYSDKYNGSTYLFLHALYTPEKILSEIDKKILLSVDSGYKGYYAKNGEYEYYFRSSTLKWWDLLGIDWAEKLCQKNTIKTFNDFQKEYQLHTKFYINDEGYLIYKKGKYISEFFPGGLQRLVKKEKFELVRQCTAHETKDTNTIDDWKNEGILLSEARVRANLYFASCKVL